MPDTHAHAPDDIPQLTFVHPADCPFPPEFLTRRFGFQGIPLTEDDEARCVRARRLNPVWLIERLTLTCSPAPVLPDGVQPAYPLRGHHHAELLWRDRRLHIETIQQTLSGPGGTNREVRVYVDGVLEGRSILLGRLGATVDSFPVIAAVGTEVVLTIAPVGRTSLETLNVELWAHRAPPG